MLTFDSSDRLVVGAGSASIGHRIESLAVSNGASIAIRGRSSDALGYLSWHANATATEYARIQSDNTSSLQFYVGSGPTEVFRATSSSLYTASGINVGIGTSLPGAKLDVVSSSSTVAGFTSTSSSAFLALANSGATTFIGNDSTSGNFIIQTPSSGYSTKLTLDNAGNLGLGVTPSASTLPTIQSAYGITIGNNEAHTTKNAYYNSGWKYATTTTAARFSVGEGGSDFRFYTAASGTAGNTISFTQAMTLTAGGNLLVGATAVPSASVEGICFTGTSSGNLSSSGSSTSAYNHLLFYNGNGVVGSISTSGSLTTYSVSSDYRLKDITGPITTSGAYIDSLNPVEGTWKADGSTFVGLIAHEAQEASRTTVATGTKDGVEMQGMDYSSAEIIANLIAEVKSLRQRLSAANL
jgi:hypothetical protein